MKMEALEKERVRRGLLYVGVGAVAFQVAHFFEHILQAGYWIAHPSEAPWLTPWAAVGRDALAAGGSAVTGTEYLHLLGNAIFFVGLVALCMLFAGAGHKMKEVRPLKIAVWIQGFHVAEHVLLTGTLLGFGKAYGFSTLFGALNGTALGAHRVWWHFAINLAATIYAVKAVRGLQEKEALLPDLSLRSGLVPTNA